MEEDMCAHTSNRWGGGLGVFDEKREGVACVPFFLGWRRAWHTPPSGVGLGVSVSVVSKEGLSPRRIG